MPDEKFTFFWGEWPFSQWSMIGFKIDDVQYNCAEQWMMACKARHFKDDATLKKIMDATTPREQKALGRQVKNFVSSEWNKVCKAFVMQGNIAKFKQHPDWRKKLFDTVGTTLVEASPYDGIWGIKLPADDPRALDRKTWRGTNWLGEVLTEVRDFLMTEEQTRGHKR